MAPKSKAAKFFCENCGAEVPAAAKMCRHCGRFFSSVRCPQCGTTGNPDKFANGCPTCGYAIGGNGACNSSKNRQLNDKKVSRSSRKSLKSAISERHDSLYGRQQKGDESLPWWVYVVMTAILLGMLGWFVTLLR